MNPLEYFKDRQAYRMSICEQCDKLTNNKSCTQCGCDMNIKTWLPLMKCPLNKWD